MRRGIRGGGGKEGNIQDRYNRRIVNKIDHMQLYVRCITLWVNTK